MNSADAVDLGRQALVLLLVVGAPVLLTGLVIGLVVSFIQAVTQIQDQTLTFVPKIVGMLVALVLCGGWMIGRIVEFARAMFGP